MKVPVLESTTPKCYQWCEKEWCDIELLFSSMLDWYQMSYV